MHATSAAAASRGLRFSGKTDRGFMFNSVLRDHDCSPNGRFSGVWRQFATSWSKGGQTSCAIAGAKRHREHDRLSHWSESVRVLELRRDPAVLHAKAQAAVLGFFLHPALVERD